MKFSATLSILATLATQAYCQDVVAFQAKGQDLTLTAPEGHDQPLAFSKGTGQDSELWHELNHGSRLFAYQNVATGDYINCETDQGICRSFHEPQIFMKYDEGPDAYFTVNDFSSFLERTNSSQLQLARPSSDYIKDSQLFTLEPQAQCKWFNCHDPEN